MMRAAPGDYLHQLQSLLPVGQAWSRQPGATLTKLLDGIALELGRAHDRLVDLVEEADPQTTTELLGDWERVVGLPDCCIGIASTVEARRAAVVARLAHRGGQSAAYYMALCAGYGWAITVTDYRLFRAGWSRVGDQLRTATGEMFRTSRSTVGQPLATTSWPTRWQVDGSPTVVETFQVGRSTVGQPLRIRDNPGVRCLIEAAKPAHTTVTYRFPLATSDPLDAPVTLESTGVMRAGDAIGLALAWRRFTTFRSGNAPLVVYAPFDGGYGRHSAAALVAFGLAIEPAALTTTATTSTPWDSGSTRWDQGLTAWSLA